MPRPTPPEPTNQYSIEAQRQFNGLSARPIQPTEWLISSEVTNRRNTITISNLNEVEEVASAEDASGTSTDYYNAAVSGLNNSNIDDDIFDDWRPLELKVTVKGIHIQTVTIDSDTFKVIGELTQALIDENVQILSNLCKLRLDFINYSRYDELVESYYPQHEEINKEGEACHKIREIVSTSQRLIRGDVIYAGYYLKALEAKARQRYDVEYSHYHYYPRLKNKVKYGDVEMLNKILTVTQIRKGKVKCK